MKKLLMAITLIILIAFTGCASGGSVILDKAAITKANNAIKDLAKIVESYKRLNDGKLPQEDQPLLDSLRGFLTEAKKEQFLPSFENTYKKMVAELITQKGGVMFTNEEYGAMIAAAMSNKEDVDMSVEEMSAKITTYLNDAQVPSITESEIYEAANSFLKKNQDELFSYGEVTGVVGQARIEKGMKEMLSEKDLDGVKKDAKKIYRSTLPPFNTNPEKGGWDSPKWVIVQPDAEVVYQHRYEDYVEKFNREPSRATKRNLRKEALTFSENSKIGYVVWVANDSNNTLVYAKVN